MDRSASSAVQIAKLEAIGAKCSGCPFLNRKDFRPVLPVIPEKPYGVIIGESPGREEAEKQEPFVGATGEALNEELTQVKLLRTKLVMINAIACLPTTKNIPTMNKAFHACRPLFLHYMKDIDPKLPVFAMGAWAMAAFTGKRKRLEKARGFVRNEDLDQSEVVRADDAEESDDETV